MTRLEGLYQSGCLKVRLPRTDAGAEAVLINTSGGLTDGDELTGGVHWREKTSAVVSSQAAERIYRSRGAAACIRNTLSVDAGATAAWLPQETILFDGGRLARSLTIRLQESSTLIALESTVLGRTAMGETVRAGAVRDRWEVWIGDELVLVDASELSSAEAFRDLCDEAAILDGATCFATLVYAANGCASQLAPLRAALADRIVVGGASCLGPLLLVRVASRDAAALRAAMLDLLSVLCARHPQVHVPGVWSL
ncbi:MAG: urease accessory protein UreD [Pseudomonadota bacterium]